MRDTGIDSTVVHLLRRNMCTSTISWQLPCILYVICCSGLPNLIIVHHKFIYVHISSIMFQFHFCQSTYIFFKSCCFMNVAFIIPKIIEHHNNIVFLTRKRVPANHFPTLVRVPYVPPSILLPITLNFINYAFYSVFELNYSAYELKRPKIKIELFPVQTHWGGTLWNSLSSTLKEYSF